VQLWLDYRLARRRVQFGNGLQQRQITTTTPKQTTAQKINKNKSAVQRE
jgi:hypothetical protein